MRISDWSSDVCSSDLAAHLLHDLGSRAVELAALVIVQRYLPHLEAAQQIGILAVAARLQFLAGIAALCVLGDQRGAVAHLVLPILRVEGLHRAGLVLSRLVLADTLRERRGIGIASCRERVCKNF